MPQQLIKRVDTVFGGASAVYGSDALTGVVNFVLDNKLLASRASFPAAQTTYGDDQDWKVALTAGTSFVGDRGHFIISGEAGGNDGILSAPTAARGITRAEPPWRPTRR